jgi:glucose 1-dehydrogenase
MPCDRAASFRHPGHLSTWRQRTWINHVNSIAPGAIRTPINTAAWQTPEAYEALMTLVPYKRIGETDDIGHAAVWLASDAADYVTGISLYIDGGMTLYPGFATGG